METRMWEKFLQRKWSKVLKMRTRAAPFPEGSGPDQTVLCGNVQNTLILGWGWAPAPGAGWKVKGGALGHFYRHWGWGCAGADEMDTFCEVVIFSTKEMLRNDSQMEFGKCLLSFNFILDPLIHPLFLYAVLSFKVTSVWLEITCFWPRKRGISQSPRKCAEERFSGA